MVRRLQREAPRTGLGAATGTFVDHVAGVASRYGRQLFHCYDDERVPSTTNSLEGVFGVTKSQIRGAVGAASTANGVAHNLGADYIEALLYTRAHTRTQVLEELAGISASEYEAARDCIEQAERFPRLRRSRRRHPERHLGLVLDAWLNDQPMPEP